jgi:hypothetical protein
MASIELDSITNEDVLASTTLKEEQLKATYAERIVKDKQAAKLGLDNVMKTSEESKALNPNFVYTPKYEDTP